jgi:hypothetical protein
LTDEADPFNVPSVLLATLRGLEGEVMAPLNTGMPANSSSSSAILMGSSVLAPVQSDPVLSVEARVEARVEAEPFEPLDVMEPLLSFFTELRLASSSINFSALEVSGSSARPDSTSGTKTGF